MLRSFLSLAFIFSLTTTASASVRADASLLELCGEFGETTQECSCYLEEVKNIYAPADIELAGGVARAFMNGQEPEAIAAYLLFTRKITITHANTLYKIGDPHTKRVGKICEDKTQKLTPAMKAKRDLMTTRLEKIGARYRVGQTR